MHLLADMPRFEILGKVLGQQVAAIGRRIDQHVGRGTGDRPVEHHLERLVACLARVEAQVVAEDDEAVGLRLEVLGDVGKIDEVGLVDLDQAQAARRIAGKHRLDERAFAGAAGARQQHVVGRQSGNELPRILVDRLFLRVDGNEVRERDRMRMRHRLQRASAIALAPARRGDLLPVRVGSRGGQQRLDAREHGFRPCNQLRQIAAHVSFDNPR